MIEGKIITLIPGYKSTYFVDLLMSLKSQQSRPAHILLSDDSQNDEYLTLRESPQLSPLCDELNLTVLRGPKRGARQNIEYLLRTAASMQSDYIHILMDDDIIFPDYYSAHLAIHQKYTISCSVSRRIYCLDNRIPVHAPRVPEAIDRYGTKNLLLGKEFIFQTVLNEAYNWLGELSCIVFKKRFIEDNNIYELDRWDTHGLADVSSVMKAAIDSNVGYINSNQGFFRLADQSVTTSRNNVFSASVLAWLPLGFVGFERSYIQRSGLEKISDFVNYVYQRDFSDSQVICLLLEVNDLIKTKRVDQAAYIFKNNWGHFISRLENRYAAS
jgi:hypothetical protein